MKKIFTLLATATILMACANNEKAELQAMIDTSLELGSKQAMHIAEELFLQNGRLPRTFEDDEIKTAEYHSWICGFYPGVLWQLYSKFPERQELKVMAMEYTNRVSEAQWLTNTHDLGFMIFCSYGKGYEILGIEDYKDVIINACNSLVARYNDTTKTIKSWDSMRGWQFPVIIDNMMNLEMLMWGAEQTGEQRFADIANTHAYTTMANHFREDYSTYHVVSYDLTTGQPEAKQTHQGYADDSAWARGQSWGLYGYTMMYRLTGYENYLKQACHIANYIASHPNLPADGVPYWDFNCPNIPNTYRDASAGAVMASAFLELSQYDKKDGKKWRELAIKQLRTLSSPEFLAAEGENGGFLLKHSVGNLNKNSEVDVPLSYADYYYIEALLRLEKML